MTQIIIDSGAILAAIDDGDKFHNSAANFLRSQSDEVLFLVPELIFSETMTLIKARLGAIIAINVGERLRQSSRFQILEQSEADRDLTWEVFQRYSDKNWSYADCSILALSDRTKTNIVFSFDHHIV